MKHILFTFILFSNLVISSAYAKSLNYYLSLLDNHPKVQAVMERQDALKHQADGAMGLPDPSVFLGVDNVPLSDPSFDQYLPSSKIIGFSQNIPSSRGRKAQRDVFLSTATNTQLMAEYVTSRLYSQFFSRIADLQRIEQQSNYEEKKKQIIAQLQEYYQGQIVAGEPIYQKTFLIEIQLAEVEQKLNTLHAQKSSVEADLLQLVGEVPELEERHFERKIWSGELSELYPVQLALRNIDVEQDRIELAESAYSPDFGVVGTYKIREDGAGDSFDGDDWFSIQFRLSVPLWAHENQRPKLEAAKSRRKSAQYSYQEVMRKWRMETTRLESEQEAFRRNVQVLNRKDIAIKEKIEAMERTYSAGQTSLEPVLQAELTRLSLLSQIAETEARYITTGQELNAHISTREFHEPE